MDSKLEY